jgi:hypothetical protein
MGTKAGTIRDTKAEGEARTFNACVAKAKPLWVKYTVDDNVNIWEMIDLSRDFVKKHNLKPSEISRIWKTAAFGKDESKGDANSYNSTYCKFGYVAHAFSFDKDDKAMGLYMEYRGKVGIHSIYNKLKESEPNAIKRKEKKDAKAKELAELEKMAEEGKIETIKTTTTPNKKKETENWTNPKVDGRGYDLDRDLMKQMKELYMGEPDKFFKMIARILTADVNPIPTKWKVWRKAAEMELK